MDSLETQNVHVDQMRHLAAMNPCPCGYRSGIHNTLAARGFAVSDYVLCFYNTAKLKLITIGNQ